MALKVQTHQRAVVAVVHLVRVGHSSRGGLGPGLGLGLRVWIRVRVRVWVWVRVSVRALVRARG